ncbi:hypothetical protein SK128_008363 [Halocaridina rubra]|uniref:Phospholipid scramblase n=1 Tax=Halocaridina rubra TaxID=373956 RepID=A0AAN8WHG1_HALRR
MEVITQQPMGGGFGMQLMPNVPHGLEYLAQLDQILIQQFVSVCEVLSGCEAQNRYILKNSMGQEFMSATEVSECCERQCCANIRSFEMPFIDNNGIEVIRLIRPFRFSSCCCPCFNQTMEITASGQLLGTMHQEWNFCLPLCTTYTIKDSSGDTAFKIKAPCWPCSCGSDVVFDVIGKDGKRGDIRRTWKGCCTECCTDADNFCVSFDRDMDVRSKALMLGAAFLIDFIYFERNS